VKYPITPEYITELPNDMAALFLRLEAFVLTDICSRLKNSGTVTETAIEQIRALQRQGYSLKAIEDYIKKTLKLSDKEFDTLWSDAVERNQSYFDAVVDKTKLAYEAFDEVGFNKLTDAIAKQTLGEIHNITQSMGFAVQSGGKVVFLDIAEAYQKVLDDAAMKVQSGTQSYNEAIREATKQLTDSGLQTVDYASGWHNRVDVAARRAVMTGITQLSSKYTEQEAEIVNTPYREVSAHRGARDVDKPNPWSNHKKWQGKVYSMRAGDKYPSIYAVCGLGEVDGLEGANCRHMHFIYVDGVSERTYTDEELANIDKPPFQYQGKTYTAYQATQKQRQIETAIRQTKREIIAADARGDTETYTAKAAKLQRLKQEYQQFSSAADLPMQNERMIVAGFGPKEGTKAKKLSQNVQ